MRASQELASEAGVATMRRIKSLSQSRKLNTQLVAQKFVLERVVARLFSSDYAEMFALKGGMLMMHVEDVAPLLTRATEDVDLQVPGFDGSIDEFEDIVREVLSQPQDVDDGIRFDLGRDRIRRTARGEGDVPGGSLHIPSQVGHMGIKFKIDVTFNSRPVFSVAVDDEVAPILPERFGPVRIRRIPMSWTLADKVQAQVRHGAKSTRLKDFYDMFLIVDRGLADPAQTVDALRMTFDLFGCPMPGSVDDIPAFSQSFAERNAPAWEAERRTRRFAVEVPDLPTVSRTIRGGIGALIALANEREPSPAAEYTRTAPFSDGLRERMASLKATREDAPIAAPGMG